MREFCSRIVETCRSFWGTLGWGLFLGTLILPLFIPFSQVIIWLVVAMLVVLWWIIDLTDQMVPWWQILVGILMLGIGTLPKGCTLIVACWVIYWCKVRE